MRLSIEIRNSIKEFARRFRDNQPILCLNHSPDGLPIDKPLDSSISENHPYIKFQKLITDEIIKCGYNPNNVPNSVAKEITDDARKLFKETYHMHSDERACVVCYRERKSSKHMLSYRMIVPKKYDEIPEY